MSIEHLQEWYWQGKAKLLGRNRSHYHCVHPKSNMSLTVIKPGPFKWKQRKPASDMETTSGVVLPWRNSPSGPRPHHCRGFTITVKHTTLGRTLPDEWSARRRDLYLTTNNTHNRHTSMTPVRFEHTIPQASDRRTTLQTARPLALAIEWHKVPKFTSISCLIFVWSTAENYNIKQHRSLKINKIT
jgi:hypothetical protein